MGLWTGIGLFAVAAVMIGITVPRLSTAADQLANIAGLGRSLAGALVLGASTSLPGIIVSFKTVLAGQANVAVSKMMGGIAAQPLYNALADAAYRESELEYQNTLAIGDIVGGNVFDTIMLAIGDAACGLFTPKKQRIGQRKN